MLQRSFMDDPQILRPPLAHIPEHELLHAECAVGERHGEVVRVRRGEEDRLVVRPAVAEMILHVRYFSPLQCPTACIMRVPHSAVQVTRVQESVALLPQPHGLARRLVRPARVPEGRDRPREILATRLDGGGEQAQHSPVRYLFTGQRGTFQT